MPGSVVTNVALVDASFSVRSWGSLLQTVLVVATLALCLVFLAAAFAKFDSWRAWSGVAADFAGGSHLGRLVAWAIPLLELVTACLLLLRPATGLALSSVLLLGFGVGVLVLRSSHAGATCNCFGAVAPSQIGLKLAMRDFVGGVFAGLAAVAAASDGVTSPTGPAIVLAALVGALLLVAAECRSLKLTTRLATEEAKSS